MAIDVLADDEDEALEEARAADVDRWEPNGFVEEIEAAGDDEDEEAN